MKSALLLVILCSALAAQGPEDFRVEITGLAWGLDVNGRIQSGVTPIDLRNDLALDDRTTWGGRGVFKPGNRHRIVAEGFAYRFEGENQLSRTITFGGQTYTFSDVVGSDAAVNYAFGGYEYAVLGAPRGHLALGGGIAYLDATGSLSSRLAGVEVSRSERTGAPLASLSVRRFLNNGPLVVSVSGEVRGMALGRFGHYVHGAAGVGVGNRRVTGRIGYGFLNMDLHDDSQPTGLGINGLETRFRGLLLFLEVRLF